MREVGVTGIHIAERDTQRAVSPKPIDVFWNTWSVDGFISEGLQPAEHGWGTHEQWMPANARTPADPAAPGIFLEQPGAETRVRTWCPSHGEQYGFLVTHNEALSISDFFTVGSDDGGVEYRPTCHYGITRATTRSSRSTSCSARADVGRRDSTCSTRTRSSTAATSSACCSTATPATPTGTGRS